MISKSQKATIDSVNFGNAIYRSRGLRTRHVMKEEIVNVGDPNSSHKDRVSADKPKQRES